MGAAGCCSGIRMQRIVATYMQQSVAAAALRPKGQPVECKGYFCIYFWMLRHSVVRSMLRSRAARVRFPPHARRAANSLPFSLSGMMPYAASEGKGAVVAECPGRHPFGCLAYFSIYFWSLRHNVVRSMPSFRAAWVRFPPHARRAANSLPFSPSGMVPYTASGGRGAVVAVCPRGPPLGCLAYFSIYFCSLRHSVVRSMPSLRAAWVRFPPHARRAANSLPFSPSGMVPYTASGGRGAVVAVCPRGPPLGCLAYFSIYFCSLRHSVVRSMPSLRAAWVRFPPHARRAANSLPFSPSGMVPYTASGGRGAVVAVCPRGPPLGCLAYFSIYFCSLRHSVVRSMPSLRAAWVRFPPHARRAANSLPFSPSGTVPYAASGGKGLLLPSAPEGTHLDV